MNEKLTGLQKTILTFTVVGVLFVVDYYRVACCDTAFGCVKCQSYLEYYGFGD